MAKIIYDAIEKTAKENGHDYFKKYCEAKGILIIIFGEPGHTSLHAIGEICWADAIDHIEKEMLVDKLGIPKELVGLAE